LIKLISLLISGGVKKWIRITGSIIRKKERKEIEVNNKYPSHHILG